MGKAKGVAEEKRLPLRVMFQDEARFGRINDPKRCWSPKGIRPEVRQQIVREYTYAYGAVSPQDGMSDFLILPAMTQEIFEIFLEEISKRHAKEFVLMFYDGAPCHTAMGLKIPENIQLERLPPYSPQLNPVENIWEEVREKFFPNLVFNSMGAVEDRLSEALLHLENNPKIVQSITAFEWIVSNL